MTQEDAEWMSATSRGWLGRIGRWAMRPPLLPRTPARLARLHGYVLLLRAHRWFWLRVLKV